MKITLTNPEQIAKRALFLAYNASQVLGYGILQAQSSITEEEVWINVVGNGDYAFQPNRNPTVDVYGDYVFGRMMKLGFKVEPDGILISDQELNTEYQSWAKKYGSYNALIAAAIDDVHLEEAIE